MLYTRKIQNMKILNNRDVGKKTGVPSFKSDVVFRSTEEGSNLKESVDSNK